MKVVHLTRQLDIIPMNRLGQQITIIGAGAIGSVAAITLAKMGFGNISVWDMDVVSEENMNCQWYKMSDIGKLKVDALRDLVKEFSGYSIMPVAKEYVQGTFPGIVISAVDSMAVRVSIFNQHKEAYNTNYIIDPRMAAEYALMYCMRPWDKQDIESYTKTLYTDGDAVQEKCTAKATMFTSTLISGMVCKAVKDIVVGDLPPRSMVWDIKQNSLLAWRNDGKEIKEIK